MGIGLSRSISFKVKILQGTSFPVSSADLLALNNIFFTHPFFDLLGCIALECPLPGLVQMYRKVISMV